MMSQMRRFLRIFRVRRDAVEKWLRYLELQHPTFQSQQVTASSNGVLCCCSGQNQHPWGLKPVCWNWTVKKLVLYHHGR